MSPIINSFVGLLAFLSTASAWSVSRRSLFRHCILATTTAGVGVGVANAAPADCFNDCFKNCKTIAPKDPNYCNENCKDYCADPDRTDGLSGSVSASGGEVGILGGTFGTGTVTKGEDKPPSVQLPGLDFTNQAGRKLIGY